MGVVPIVNENDTVSVSVSFGTTRIPSTAHRAAENLGELRFGNVLLACVLTCLL